MEVKRLENICLDLLLKSCGFDYFIKKPIKIKISLYCLLDEFLTEISEKVFISANVQIGHIHPKWLTIVIGACFIKMQ